MGRIPKEKIILTLYVSPRCKEKLACIQNAYSIAGRRFSLSVIVEDIVGFIYAALYLCQGSIFWKGFFKLYKIISMEDVLKSEINEVFKILEEKKHALREVLTVDLKVKEKFKQEFLGIGKEK